MKYITVEKIRMRLLFSKDLEPFVKAMYRKLEPFVEVLTYQVLSSSRIVSPGPIYLI